MNQTKKLIEEVRSLDQAATPGPFRMWAGVGGGLFTDGPTDWRVDSKSADHPTGFCEDKDALIICRTTQLQNLVAHYRTSAPKLAAMLEVAIEALENIKNHSRDCEFGLNTHSYVSADDALEKIERLAGD